MGGVSRSAAAQIFSHPDHLVIVMTEEDDRHGFDIFVKGGRLLIECHRTFANREDALVEAQRLLEVVTQEMMETIKDRSGLLAMVMNPDDRPLAELKVLDLSRIERIIADLRASGTAR